MFEAPDRPPVSGWTVFAIGVAVVVLAGVAVAAWDRGGGSAGGEVDEAESERAEDIPPALLMPIGTCFEAGPPRVGAPIEIAAIRTTECGAPHHFEVFARLDDPAEDAAEYPGATAIYEYGSDKCIGRFPTVIGVDFASSDFDVVPIQPDRRAWERGARTIACALVRTDFEPMTDSVVSPSS